MTKLIALLALYFAQGLPFGFQAGALPLLLREGGASLESIGFASLLSLPWLLKALWAPLVDRLGSPRFGRRKSWIVPMQASLALLSLVAAEVEGVRALAAIVLAMNVCAATQDIAVDGLAVSVLDTKELGPANAIQVVGYKLGMLTGGGLLVWARASIGWSGLFRAMAGLMLLVLLASFAFNERDASRSQARPVDFRAIFARLVAAFADRSGWALLAVVATYKAGEALADGMWKPLLLDRGFTSGQIGLWSGTFGMLCSLFGTSAAGLALRRVSIPSALVTIALFRALGIAAEWWLSVESAPTASSVIAVTCLEHLLGGAITTVVFALMMRAADRSIGATHYTVLASVEVLGKMPGATLSGVFAARLGYPALFATATLLSLGFAAFAWLVRRMLERPPALVQRVEASSNG